jgi:hypothetical protein|tara:strand:- start:15 stop:200 length:186 start_codon:yes stop_codon:yes gene_type:complete
MKIKPKRPLYIGLCGPKKLGCRAMETFLEVYNKGSKGPFRNFQKGQKLPKGVFSKEKGKDS